MKNEVILLNSNFEIIGFSKTLIENFNSFKELIEFANNLKKEMFKNNSEIDIENKLIKYNRYPVINNEKDIIYITEFKEIIEKENIKEEFNFDFDFDDENLKEADFVFVMD